MILNRKIDNIEIDQEGMDFVSCSYTDINYT